jgi:hypothetical protein
MLSARFNIRLEFELDLELLLYKVCLKSGSSMNVRAWHSGKYFEVHDDRVVELTSE